MHCRVATGTTVVLYIIRCSYFVKKLLRIVIKTVF